MAEGVVRPHRGPPLGAGLLGDDRRRLDVLVDVDADPEGVLVAQLAGHVRGCRVGDDERLADLGDGGHDAGGHAARIQSHQHVDLVLEDELAGGLNRHVGLDLAVLEDELHPPPEDAAGLVDLVDREPDAVAREFAVGGGHARHDVDGADLDRLLGRRRLRRCERERRDEGDERGRRLQPRPEHSLLPGCLRFSRTRFHRNLPEDAGAPVDSLFTGPKARHRVRLRGGRAASPRDGRRKARRPTP